MNKLIITLLLGLLPILLLAQDKPAYRLFDGNGKALKYKKALKAALAADIICFGESHNDPIAHWLQYEVLSDLAETKGADALVVGAEMFEADQQEVMDLYLKGALDDKGLTDSTRTWPNYKTDYQPVVAFCKAEGIPFIATNVPRKYARMVARNGGLSALDSLPDDEKAHIAPLPLVVNYELPSYMAMRDMFGDAPHGMNLDHFIAAQAIKDATMAHFLLENYPTGKTFYHLNGSYHSDSKEGILYYIAQAKPELQLFNFSVVSQSDLSKLADEHKGKADVIIVVPETMTKTY